MNEFWSRLHHEILEAQRALGRCAHTPDDLLPAAFRAHEEWCRDTVNAACLQWAASGVWPEGMTPVQMWWAGLRLGRAGKTLAPLMVARWVPPSRFEALVWLLVDAWPFHADALAAKVLPPLEGIDEEPPPPEWMR